MVFFGKMWFQKRLNTEEYLELKKALESLRISFEGLKLEFDIIRKRLRIKKRLDDEPESKDLKDMVLLPE